MKNVIKIYTLLSLFLVISSCKNNNSPEEGQLESEMEFSHRIPAGENSWVSGDTERTREIIQKDGIRNWTGTGVSIDSYFRLAQAGELELGLRVRAQDPTGLRISLNGESKEITVENTDFRDIRVGAFRVGSNGYQKLEISQLGEDSSATVEIKEILLNGSATEGAVSFVEDNFHFGRRGPSVHLRYEYPEEKEVVYFYNEIEVPEGEDVIGSYFMANGFSHGYFGIQVNSESERRILFSVWSPYETQDPDEIPEDYRIELLKKGEGVHAGKFGNEGSGGQSYKVFDWKSDTTYRFLLKGEPVGDNHTDFTAYFYAPENQEWELIASFRRPYTDSYLEDLYSFLENFRPGTGDISRKALYKNQWIYDTGGEWTQSTSAKFTADATADQGHRMDYAGGVEGTAFYMKNCGFFDDYTEMDTIFEREANMNPPSIDFNSLP